MEHLRIAHGALGKRPRVWLAGDSSLDCKFYIPRSGVSAVNGYDRFLVPPVSKRDVCYWLNTVLEPTYAVINCAVEESTIQQRQTKLLAQDEFLRDHISADDILVVSAGGNDIALRPTFATVWNIIKAVHLNSTTRIETTPEKVWGMPHFRSLFRDMTRHYIEQLVSKTRPKRVIVCMIYFPDEANTPSWAGPTLSCLQYNSNPERLQAIIRGVFECATMQIQLDGVDVVGCPLFDAMNGKDSLLYVDRVEPSEKGGLAISELLTRYISRQSSDS